MDVGRRIIYDKVSGEIMIDLGEMQGDVLPRNTIELDYLDLPYGQDSDKFNRVKKYHVDVTTKAIIFDELYDPPVDKDEEIASLQQQLLTAQGVI